MVAVLLPAFLAPLVLAGSPLVMGLLLVPAGIFIAPLIATRNELAGVVAPAGSEPRRTRGRSPRSSPASRSAPPAAGC